MSRVIWKFTKGLLILSLLSLSCVGVSGCAKEKSINSATGSVPVCPDTEPDKADEGDVIANFGGTVITAEEYKEELALLPPVYRAMANSNKQQFIDSLVNKHLLLEEAKRLCLQSSENVKKLLEKAKEEIMVQELIGIEITDKIKVTNDDIEKYYQQNKEKYIEPAKTKVSHILVDSEVVAQKILADLRNGADFAKEAKEYSLDLPTKDKGGDTGEFSKGMFLPEFEDAVSKLEAGETSGVVKTGLGYHIIKVTDRKEAEPQPIENVKGEIENELFVEKQIDLYEALMKKLKEGKDIRIDNEAIDSLTTE